MRISSWFATGYGPLSAALKAVALTLALWPGMAMAEAVRIVALGDSLTAGYGLPRDEGFVPQLQDWLAGQGAAVEIVNAGVSGDTTAGGLARLDWSLDAQTDALIVTLGGNDLLRGIPPETARQNLDQILRRAGERGLPVLLIGLYASANYGAGYKAAFDAIYPELAEEHGALYEPNFFQGLADGSGDPSGYLEFMQPDGIHPDAEGVARIVDRIGPRVLELVAQVD